MLYLVYKFYCFCLKFDDKFNIVNMCNYYMKTTNKIGRKILEEKLQSVIDDGVMIPAGPNENKIQGWWYSDEEIIEANKKGEMLTLDLDVGSACHYNCSFCFAKTHRINSDVEKETSKLKNILDEAAGLGVKSIKIVGAGEPTLFPNLLNVVDYANNEHGIQSIIFTTGDIFGNDNLASKVYGKRGIKSGKDLAKRFYDANASLIVKYMTFDRDKEKAFCGVNDETLDNKVEGLINLFETGFASSNTTRLGIDFLMLKGIKQANGTYIEGNSDEAVEAFELFNKYNIFSVLNTSMDCGGTRLDEKLSVGPIALSKQDAYNVAKKLYSFCREKRIPFDERISPYFLAPACSQLNHGMYISQDRNVKSCPGQPLTKEDIAEGKVDASIGVYEKNGDLQKIWDSNPDKKACIAHKCPSRCGRTYFSNFEEKIKESLKGGNN